MLKIFKIIQIFALVALSLATQATQAPRIMPPFATKTCPTENNKIPRLVLSIDGAAVRGIAQFELLQAIEERVNEELAKIAQAASKGEKFKYERINITEMFDFFAGTSAGSVNVGALLMPKNYSLANTSNYKNEPKFTLDELKNMLPDTLRAAFSATLFRKFRTLQIPGLGGGLLGSKFTATPFEQLLQEYTGKARMSDLVKPAVITSYDLRGREVINFSTYEACARSPDDVVIYQPPSDSDFYRKGENVYLWQAIRASSSAPIYYKPLELEIGGKPRALIDAGLFVMSPALLAWVEAQKVYPDDPLTIISISSGYLTEARKVQTGVTAGGIATILVPTIESALEGQQALTDLMMKGIPGIKYHRLSFEVKNKDFDDTSPATIKLLEESAQKTISSQAFTLAINDIVAAIVERREKSKKNSKAFGPYICKAKEEFRKNINLSLSPEGPSSAVTKAKIRNALDKILKASEEMGTPNEQGTRMVEFSNSEKDQELKKAAILGRRTCQGLLGQGKTQTGEWADNHCDNVLDAKEICQGLNLRQCTIEADLNNNNCNKFSFFKKPPACSNLSDLLKKNAQEQKARKCEAKKCG